MRIALHGRKFSKESFPYVKTIANKLLENGHEIFITDVCARENKSEAKAYLASYRQVNILANLDSIDFFFSLGGDGTLLETVSIVGAHEIPILGINLGTMGFLATTAKSDISTALDLLFDGQYELENRTLLHLNSNSELFDAQNFALNEVAILKRDTSSMIIVRCYIDGAFVNTYWADGLMVSTPTGSTGYSLSCGGPLVLSQSDSFIITPVSPHNLNVRPLVVSDKSEISFEIEGKGRSFLVSLDSRSHTVNSTVKISLTKANFTAKLVNLSGSNFFDTLRNKLNWGQDVRN
ncbi:NAD kinase [Reichenbachiella carrageenanivorans]|uniref:NAD kinase n=1 Tax=Reichenbachiella carrageenanivorans TaxID=2979869 RepID=A0ABY6D226_9BACT|nr:NAD kinase [Reichenbachiella carrageenanivorans]UXX80196.1 NAD kinase [Reichenbachiella carrageenanivorans]